MLPTKLNKYDIWRILSVMCYIDNFVYLRGCIRNINMWYIVLYVVIIGVGVIWGLMAQSSICSLRNLDTRLWNSCLPWLRRSSGFSFAWHRKGDFLELMRIVDTNVEIQLSKQWILNMKQKTVNGKRTCGEENTNLIPPSRASCLNRGARGDLFIGWSRICLHCPNYL
jgi:hypothetical protein